MPAPNPPSRFERAFGPLSVVLVAIPFKALILEWDKIDRKDANTTWKYLFDNYLNPMWFDLLVSSFFLMIVFASKVPESGRRTLKNLWWGVGGIAFINAILNGLIRLKLVQPSWFSVELPILLSVILFVTVSFYSTEDFK